MIAKINTLIFKLTKQDDYYLKNSAGRLVGVFLLLATIQFGVVCILDYVGSLPSQYKALIWISSIVLLVVTVGIILTIAESADSQYERSYQYLIFSVGDDYQVIYDRSVDGPQDIEVDIFRHDKRTIGSDDTVSGSMLKTMREVDTVVGIRLSKSGVYVGETHYMHLSSLGYMCDGDLDDRYLEFIISRVEVCNAELSIYTAGGIHKRKNGKVVTVYFETKDPSRAERLNEERKSLEARERMMR